MANDKTKEIAEVVADKVVLKKLNQTTLAELLGVSQPTISQILNGNRPIADKHARKLEDMLGIPYNYLRYGIGSPSKEECNTFNIHRDGNIEMDGHSQLAGNDINNTLPIDSIQSFIQIMKKQLQIIESQQDHNNRLIKLLEDAMQLKKEGSL